MEGDWIGEGLTGEAVGVDRRSEPTSGTEECGGHLPDDDGAEVPLRLSYFWIQEEEEEHLLLHSSTIHHSDEEASISPPISQIKYQISRNPKTDERIVCCFIFIYILSSLSPLYPLRG